MLTNFDSKLFLDEFLVAVSASASCVKAFRMRQVRLNKIFLLYELYELGDVLLGEIEKLELSSKVLGYNKTKNNKHETRCYVHLQLTENFTRG